MKALLDATDRRIVNLLQEGLPLSPTPYLDAAGALGIPEEELLRRLARLKTAGILSRIGPLYDSARFGGGLTLCAMMVPAERLEEVAAIVNSFAEVAHNYERDHQFNMWFVVATESESQVAPLIKTIEHLTGLRIINLPKLDEYYIGLKIDV